ncbi:MAG TPA: PTS sugar transporter subunit IIC [Defluviitaleaceae bacterium]|jgi:PTS system mannose-specific IIC component|nr:PTS sugar transporter subunit IIC [Candidatus Epulonipiscium sp.]HOQ16785.1 PTS sugar transporter subunit IIC [Defluviitaleaceae bacterium]HPT75631.1 PTS sugar transporter subunit IIC [Defluviitaleaceae bacterium]HQD50572.1 PTS sugar transporter subunit IIC [Defluviitaleaceae bacterium]
MQIYQIILIALFIYLGSIGSIVGNTIGWYTLGRPLVASFVVGLIMGDVQTAILVGISLQIMYMGNVTPGGAVAWDLSYATYIGTAAALVFGKGLDTAQVIGLAVVFAGIGGLVGQIMWNLSYALNLPLNRVAQRYAEAGETKKMFIPNVVLGQLIGFACRFIPAVIVLTSMTAASAQGDFASLIPGWLTTVLGVFGGMMAALGMGIILSFLFKKKYHVVIFLAGFILVTYFNLSTMAVAVLAIIIAVLYYVAVTNLEAKRGEVQ